MTRLKDKERILKSAREKHGVTYKGAPIKLESDYSTESFQAISGEISKVLKGKDLQPRLLYLASLSFEMEGEMSFPDMKKLKEFVNTKPVVQQKSKRLF